MSRIRYRCMEPDEVGKIEDIYRSEQIRTGYEYTGGELQQMDVNWDTPTWLTDGVGDLTIAAQIKFGRDHLQKSGRMYGAFDCEKLVGIGIIQQGIRKGEGGQRFHARKVAGFFSPAADARLMRPLSWLKFAFPLFIKRRPKGEREKDDDVGNCSDTASIEHSACQQGYKHRTPTNTNRHTRYIRTSSSCQQWLVLS